MVFLNTFLVVVGKREQRRNKNKQIKTLNTLLHSKPDEAP